jgi:hypothetical protein
LNLSAAHLLTGAGLLAAVLSHQTVNEAAPKGLSPREYNVFAATEHQSRVALIDPDLLAVVDSIDLGFEVRQLAVSARLRVVAATDGQSPEVRVYDLATDQRRSIALPFVPSRLVRAPDDTRLAAVDNPHGKLAVIDLQQNTILTMYSVTGSLGDVLFSTGGGTLYLAGQNHSGIVAVDIDGNASREVDGTGEAAFAGLSRSPNGRDGFGKPVGGSEIDEFDLRRQTVIGHLDVTPDTSFAFVTGTGRFVLLPDSHRGELQIATTDPLKVVASLKGSSNMDAAYSAWFDTLAFVTSPSEHRLLAYDLDQLKALTGISLDGTPGPVLVGPGGDKLFVPLTDAKAVQVVDAAKQRVIARVALDDNPTAMTLAGSYGICH